MKRMIAVCILVALAAGSFSACANTSGPASQSTVTEPSGLSAAADSDKIRVISTIFPGYDFARAVGGEHIELEMLLPPGSESHSFEPSPQDIIRIQNCDVLIRTGFGDDWMDTILDSMDTSDKTILAMTDLVETVDEEIVDGMEHAHEEDHDHDAIDPASIHDRPLSDWAGDWDTIETALESGALDEYAAQQAAENETDAATQKQTLAARWRSDYPSLKITADEIALNDNAARYQYIGYRYVEGDHPAVWYGFESTAEASDLPKYVAFSDHGTGGDEHEEDGHEEHHEGPAHFHFRYGNESFEALAAMEGWGPTYFTAGTPDSEMAEAMGAHSHSHAHALDEHVWTSPVNAKRIVRSISDTLCALDSSNADSYTTNATAYAGQLDEVDAALRAVVQGAARKTIVFGDRFPFRYLADEYGLEYYAAFSGCSTQTDASPKTIAFLIDKVEDEGIPVVFHIEFSNEKMADTICDSTGAKKLQMHSCHNVSAADFSAGVTYIDLMRQNAEALKEALA